MRKNYSGLKLRNYWLRIYKRTGLVGVPEAARLDSLGRYSSLPIKEEAYERLKEWWLGRITDA